MALTRVGGAVKSDRIFDTVADMVASKTVKVGDIVETAGYTTVNDGGGTKYEIVAAATGTDDGGSFIGLDTHQAKAIFGHYVALEQFGITTTVDVAKFKKLITYHNSANKQIFCYGNNYNFGGSDISNGGLTNGLDVGGINIVGIQDETIFSNIGSTNYSDRIYIKNIKFDTCVQPVYFTGNVTDLYVGFCDFNACRRAIYHNDTTAGVKLTKGLIENNYFHDHTEDDFVAGVALHRAPLTDDVTVRDNIFYRLKTDPAGTNIVLCCQIGVDISGVSAYNRNKFINNTIIECGQDVATFKNASFGCILIGEDCLQEGNTVKDGFWLEPLYMKGNNNAQINNKMHDNMHSGLSMKVITTSNLSDKNIQNNNIVTGQCDIRPAIRMFGDGQSLNSQVNITTTAQVDAQGGFGYQATRSATVGKLTVTGNFTAPKGMQLTTAGDIDIDANVDASEAKGIEILKSSDGNIGRVSVRGKIKSKKEALNVNWCEYFTAIGLDITCDHDGDPVFIYSQKGGSFEGGSLTITDDDADGNTVTKAFTVYGKDGGSFNECIYTVAGFDITSERPITSLFQGFCDTGLTSPDEYCLKISDLDVNMQGNACSFVVKLVEDAKRVVISNSTIDGSLSRTIDGSGKNIGKVVIGENIMDYIATDNLATHTNATVTTSRVGNNKTA